MGEEKSEGRRSRRVGNGRNTEKYETMVNISQFEKGLKGGSLEKRGGHRRFGLPYSPPPLPHTHTHTHTPNLLVKEQASKRTVRACIIHSPVQ